MDLRVNPVTRFAILATATLAACSGVGTTARSVSAAKLDSLPQLSVVDGRRVCEATGYDPCPLHRVVANWLDQARYALWEPGRLVRVYDGKDSTGRDVGKIGTDSVGAYTFATAVGRDDGGVAVVDGLRNAIVRFGADGNALGATRLPFDLRDASFGFSGSTPVLQLLRPRTSDSVVEFEVRLLRSPADTSGHVAIDVPLLWLRLDKEALPVRPTPLFPAAPTYAVDGDRSVVWTAGDRFEIRRDDANGKARWILTSDRVGLPVTPADIAARRAELQDQVGTKTMLPATLDSMAAATGPTHPVISGIVIAPNGAILVAGPATPSRDSVQYLVLTRDGVPMSRFTLPSRTAVVLFAGDSLLVHRPTGGEPWEVRWLQLKGGR